MEHMITWFEIPATDLDRAVTFYSALFRTELEPMGMGDQEMAFFPSDDQNVSGCVVKGPGYVPSDTGTMVYLNANPDLSVMLDRVAKAGGTILLGKTLITEDIGYMAIFLDSEGNRLALHSRS